MACIHVNHICTVYTVGYLQPVCVVIAHKEIHIIRELIGIDSLSNLSDLSENHQLYTQQCVSLHLRMLF